MPPHQTWTAVLCVALLGCAAGVEVLDSTDDPATDGVPLPDASAAAAAANPGFPAATPALVSHDAAGFGGSDLPPVVVVVIDAATGGWSTPDTAGSGQGGPATDSAVSQPANSSPRDAGSSTADASTAPAPTPTPIDAGSAPKPVDAGTQPEAAPMCQAATCTNYCGLARRCCNASSQCACMSLFGNCTLPSLRP
jgi:hypothetical protein